MMKLRTQRFGEITLFCFAINVRLRFKTQLNTEKDFQRAQVSLHSQIRTLENYTRTR